MAARPQWYFWSMGLTNRVQPYCRLAIITMQMMPKTSCPQRVASDAIRVSMVPALVAISVPLLSRALLFCRFVIYQSWYTSELFLSPRRRVAAAIAQLKAVGGDCRVETR